MMIKLCQSIIYKHRYDTQNTQYTQKLPWSTAHRSPT